MPFALKFHSGSFLFNPARYLRYPLRSDGVKTVDRLPALARHDDRASKLARIGGNTGHLLSAQMIWQLSIERRHVGG
jgi:hypothetical protein